jgi:hypothetical protein
MSISRIDLTNNGSITSATLAYVYSNTVLFFLCPFPFGQYQIWLFWKPSLVYGKQEPPSVADTKSVYVFSRNKSKFVLVLSSRLLYLLYLRMNTNTRWLIRTLELVKFLRLTLQFGACLLVFSYVVPSEDTIMMNTVIFMHIPVCRKGKNYRGLFHS